MERHSILASYCPAQLVLESIGNPAPPARAERDDFDGVIAFVDVSGFTALSENLAQACAGKQQGAELLSLYINSFFALLIQDISV